MKPLVQTIILQVAEFSMPVIQIAEILAVERLLDVPLWAFGPRAEQGRSAFTSWWRTKRMRVMTCSKNLLTLCVLVGVLTVPATGQNLLLNDSFEDPLSASDWTVSGAADREHSTTAGGWYGVGPHTPPESTSSALRTTGTATSRAPPPKMSPFPAVQGRTPSSCRSGAGSTTRVGSGPTSGSLVRFSSTVKWSARPR